MRAFSDLYSKTSWRPKRTLLFVSWDASHFGAVGSTEFLEQYSAELSHTIAYLSLDKAVTGQWAPSHQSNGGKRSTSDSTCRYFSSCRNSEPAGLRESFAAAGLEEGGETDSSDRVASQGEPTAFRESVRFVAERKTGVTFDGSWIRS